MTIEFQKSTTSILSPVMSRVGTAHHESTVDSQLLVGGAHPTELAFAGLESNAITDSGNVTRNVPRKQLCH
jgi:hypothetical protein